MRITVLLLVAMLAFHGSVAVANDATSLRFTGAAIEVEVVFSDEEIRIIRAHYDSGSAERGKSNGKHKSLPPGIAKNLARGKSLPPGIAKRTLPQELHDQLPPVTDGYERVIVDGKVLLIEIATQVVRDVLTDILID
jgi:hypothetical protein